MKNTTTTDWGFKNGNIYCNINSDDPCRIITIATIGNTFPSEVNEANGQLIAKAPELYDALSDAIKFIKLSIPRESQPRGLDKWDALITALNK